MDCWKSSALQVTFGVRDVLGRAEMFFWYVMVEPYKPINTLTFLRLIAWYSAPPPSTSTHKRPSNHQPQLFSVPASKVWAVLFYLTSGQLLFFSLFVVFLSLCSLNTHACMLGHSAPANLGKRIEMPKWNQWEADPEQMRVSDRFPWACMDGSCIFLFNTRRITEIPIGVEKWHLLSN